MLIIPADIITGVLVNAIALIGRKVSTLAADFRVADDLTSARWFETFQLTRTVPDQLDLSLESKNQLVSILNGDEIQAALQELLAVRLTDAPDLDASRARDAIVLTLSTMDPGVIRYAEALATYYDEQICALVSHLEAEDSHLLTQIRSEAFFSRMINILRATERHAAALISRPDHRSEASFIASYRRHVADQHGKLEPPDFERRRRVAIEKIFVPTIIKQATPFGQSVPEPHKEPLDVYALADKIDRSVLLGDPGGGKTTAANVLMHYFASQPTGRVPFLVTLREFAVQDPPERSVVGHIERTLETFYQCPSPPGLVDFLLLTARAVVIFDGLDELLDTSRRVDVTVRVERFCVEYPLVPVLVTSRIVGYDQACLDDSQFLRYRLGDFKDDEVAAYVRKWFALDVEVRPGDTEAFLAESRDIRDLRSNPLLLALLCILYRGAGSLPRNRAEIYEQCATLLFRRWDARRRIHQDLRAGHLLEPALRYLAWSIFTQGNVQSVTERELIAATTNFLHGRGFESEDAARDAAREFINFCRGRMWVFSDAGTTVAGEALYSFTHRTFLEYFAAAKLAYERDTPELLADSLTPHVAANEWWVLAELAVQLKDRSSNNGAKRIYTSMLDDLNRQPLKECVNILQFLALCLRSVDPSPQIIRRLTRKIVAVIFVEPREEPLENLASNCGTYSDVTIDEIVIAIDSIMHAGDSVTLEEKIKIVLSVQGAFSHFGLISSGARSLRWEEIIEPIVQRYPDVVVNAAQRDAYVQNVALYEERISITQALEMQGTLPMLFDSVKGWFPKHGRVSHLR